MSIDLQPFLGDNRNHGAVCLLQLDLVFFGDAVLKNLCSRIFFFRAPWIGNKACELPRFYIFLAGQQRGGKTRIAVENPSGEIGLDNAEC